MEEQVKLAQQDTTASSDDGFVLENQQLVQPEAAVAPTAEVPVVETPSYGTSYWVFIVVIAVLLLASGYYLFMHARD